MIQETIALAALIIFSLTGVGLSLIGIGGTFLVALGALIFDAIMWNMTIPITTIAILFSLALLGEIFEWAITLITIKTKGVSRYGLIGTILGAVLGGVILSIIPILGTILGIVLGSLLGAFLLEYYHTWNSHKSWKAAKAALLSRGIVMLTKTGIAVIQIAIVLQKI